MLTAVLATATIALAGACEQDSVAGPRLHPDVTAHSTALEPVADTYVVESEPNASQGSAPLLRLMQRSPARHRALLRFDQAAIGAAVAADSLVTATLELTIKFTPINWGVGAGIGLHRLTQAWSEPEATWNCAADAVAGNEQPDCDGATAWVMGSPPSGNPFIATPTATRVIANGITGVIQLDVTADVRAFLAGTANHGWLLKKLDETQEGRIEFASRESSGTPRLLLNVVSGDTSRPGVPSNVESPDDSMYVAMQPGDTVAIYYRRILHVVFQDTVSGLAIRAFVNKYNGQVVAGMPFSRGYTIQVPDPGPSWDSLQALIGRMALEPGIRWVLPATRRDHPVLLKGRWPQDGGSRTRSAWFAPSDMWTWAHRAVRAPMAWGCETGTYDASRGCGVGVPAFG